jgi:hypothetical protein
MESLNVAIWPRRDLELAIKQELIDTRATELQLCKNYNNTSRSKYQGTAIIAKVPIWGKDFCYPLIIR